jgi:hypothetical protein
MRTPILALSALLCLVTGSALAQTRQKLTAAPPKPAATAPAVDLPATGMVFALQSKSGASAIIPLHATEIKSNAHAGGNFARGLVYAGPHSTVELAGPHALIDLPPNTVLYIRLPSEEPDLARERATLVRLDEKPDSRQLLEFTRNVFGGSLKRKLNEVAIEKLDVEGEPVLRVTPVKPLEPGEYGITFLPKDPALFSDIVYDFTVAK